MSPDKLINFLSDVSTSILLSEFEDFKDIIYSFSKDRYYVYGLYGLGELFYIGKGKSFRAYTHLISYDSGSFKDDIIKGLYNIDEPPHVFIFDKDMSEHDALTLERDLISKRGRLINETGTLTNMLPGYVPLNELCSEKNRLGGLSLNLSGKREGCCTTDWWKENRDYAIEICKKAGKSAYYNNMKYRESEFREWSSKGGKKVGKLPFWTNGDRTVRSKECPGKGWHRGNGNFNQNSIAHSKIPLWTDGKENKKSHTKPDKGFFNGVTRKTDFGKNIIVYKKQIDYNNIPSEYKIGHNLIHEEL